MGCPKTVIKLLVLRQPFFCPTILRFPGFPTKGILRHSRNQKRFSHGKHRKHGKDKIRVLATLELVRGALTTKDKQ
jgi:hypothetical protein